MIRETYKYFLICFSSHMSQHPPNARYPDTIALAFDERNNKLTCIYNDHSIYVWDVRDIRRVGKSHSFLYHSACIWGVEMYPIGAESVGAMPLGSFITCSSDDTIRIWNLEKDISPNDTLYKRNIYSNVSIYRRAPFFSKYNKMRRNCIKPISYFTIFLQ